MQFQSMIGRVCMHRSLEDILVSVQTALVIAIIDRFIKHLHSTLREWDHQHWSINYRPLQPPSDKDREFFSENDFDDPSFLYFHPRHFGSDQLASVKDWNRHLCTTHAQQIDYRDLFPNSKLSMNKKTLRVSGSCPSNSRLGPVITGCWWYRKFGLGRQGESGADV